MAIDVIYIDPGSAGYHPVFYMARLAAELFETELAVLHPRSITTIDKFSGFLPRGRKGLAGILICPDPTYLATVLSINNWRGRYGRLVAWVFDLFWLNHVHRFVRFGRIFDHVFVTEKEDLDDWRKTLHAPVDWLPWGSDVLRLGSDNSERCIDLLRFGRQPPHWEDDASTSLMCTSRQMKFQGRPPMLADASENERALMQMLSQAKFTLSFSNVIAPSTYTHPKRPYITGRWTDALSAGATVAGIPPCSELVRSLLWKDALLDVGTVDIAKGIAALADAVRDWTPHRATWNYLRSLEVLDWRWRFERLASALDVHSPTLDTELSLLRQAINDRRRRL